MYIAHYSEIKTNEKNRHIPFCDDSGTFPDLKMIIYNNKKTEYNIEIGQIYKFIIIQAGNLKREFKGKKIITSTDRVK